MAADKQYRKKSAWAVVPDEDYLWRTDGTLWRYVGGAPWFVTLAMGGRQSQHSLLVTEDGKTRRVQGYSVYTNLPSKPCARWYDTTELRIDGALWTAPVETVRICPTLLLRSRALAVEVTEEWYPATLGVGMIKRISVYNGGDKPIEVHVAVPKKGQRLRGGMLTVGLAMQDGKMLSGLDGDETQTIPSGQEATLYAVYYVQVPDRDVLVDCVLEYKKRAALWEECHTGLSLVCDERPEYGVAVQHACRVWLENVTDTPKGLQVSLTQDGRAAQWYALLGDETLCRAVQNTLHTQCASPLTKGKKQAYADAVLVDALAEWCLWKGKAVCQENYWVLSAVCNRLLSAGDKLMARIPCRRALERAALVAYGLGHTIDGDRWTQAGQAAAEEHTALYDDEELTALERLVGGDWLTATPRQAALWVTPWWNGLLGAEMAGVNVLRLCPRAGLPKNMTWRYLHVAGRVLTVVWCDGRLTVTDLYGIVLYDGRLTDGHAVEIEL